MTSQWGLGIKRYAISINLLSQQKKQADFLGQPRTYS